MPCSVLDQHQCLNQDLILVQAMIQMHSVTTAKEQATLTLFVTNSMVIHHGIKGRRKVLLTPTSEEDDLTMTEDHIQLLTCV